jgi:DNA-binding NarL/FixJ family response regulator
MTPFSDRSTVRVALFASADLHDEIVALLQASPATITQQLPTLAAAHTLTAADADVLVVGCAGGTLTDVMTVLRLSPDRVAVPVLAIYAAVERGRVIAACQAGIRGHLLLNDARDTLARAMPLVAQGTLIISPQLWEDFSRSFLVCTSAITERDRQLLMLVAAGESNQVIAAALHCSLRGVEDRIKLLARRYGVKNRTELAAWWAQQMLDRAPEEELWERSA